LSGVEGSAHYYVLICNFEMMVLGSQNFITIKGIFQSTHGMGFK
jgi:hypothetical protein